MVVEYVGTYYAALSKYIAGLRGSSPLAMAASTLSISAWSPVHPEGPQKALSLLNMSLARVTPYAPSSAFPISIVDKFATQATIAGAYVLDAGTVDVTTVGGATADEVMGGDVVSGRAEVGVQLVTLVQPFVPRLPLYHVQAEQLLVKTKVIVEVVVGIARYPHLPRPLFAHGNKGRVTEVSHRQNCGL